MGQSVRNATKQLHKIDTIMDIGGKIGQKKEN